MNKLIQTIEQKCWGVVGITGIRVPTDVSALRQHFGDDFVVSYLQVMKRAIGCGRAQHRGEERDPQDHQQSLMQDKAEEEIFSLNGRVWWADIAINHDGRCDWFCREREQSPVQDLTADGITPTQDRSRVMATEFVPGTG